MGGETYVNDVLQVEEFVQHEASYYFQPPEVPSNHALLFGDNRGDSYDSHEWECPFLPVDEISGKVVHICKYSIIRAFTLVYLDYVCRE